MSLKTQFESGIPPARLRDEVSLEGGVERLELALAHVTRTEANLGLVLRGLKHLAAGATAARDANADLSRELDELRTHLARGNEEEHALRFRMGQLEQLLDVIRHESARERAFLIEQQDQFLVQIMNDHERQVADLRRMLKDALTRGGRQPHQAPPSPICAAMDQNEFSEVTEEELRGASPRRISSPRAAASHGATGSSASATAIGSVSLRAVQVPAPQHASSSKQSAVNVDDDGDRPTTSYSLSGTEIAD
ncbi:MAG: hypothetical protein ABJB12_21870 [Pseudomonadota bacterium]